MPATKAKRRQPSIPRELRKEVVAHVRAIAQRYRAAFAADAGLKTRVLTLTRALLPPRPKPRGRPRNHQTTRAILLCRRFRRQHPEEKPHEIWDRVCRVLYSEYDRLPDVGQRDIRDALRGRVKSRTRSRRVRKSH